MEEIQNLNLTVANIPKGMIISALINSGFGTEEEIVNFCLK
jgi:hypothetical protein